MSDGHLLVPAISAVVALVAGAVVLRPGARRASSWPAALVLVSAAGWAVCQVVQRSTDDVGLHRAMEVAHLPMAATAVFGAMWFATLYTAGRWTTRKALVLGVQPVLVSLLALTSPWQNLLVGDAGDRNRPLFWIQAGYAHAVMAVAIGTLVVAAQAAVRDRWTMVVAIVATAAPMAANLSTLAHVNENGGDLTPTAFVVMMLLWLWAERGAFGIRPRAPITVAQVVEAIDDGLIVVDERGRVVVGNGAARRILADHGSGRARRGTHWRELVHEDSWEVVGRGGLLQSKQRWFDVRLSPIEASGRRVGTVAQLRDVTESEAVRADLAEQAVSDALTGLRNRRFFVERGEELIAQARADGRQVAAAMVDIDHFKVVNDTFGHPVGDRVLARVAAQVQRRARVGDAQVRFGGEEFLLLMVGETLAGAVERMEDLRQACAQIQVPTREGTVGITVSIGVCEAAPGAGAQALLQGADRALYLAKERGRNQVCTV